MKQKLNVATWWRYISGPKVAEILFYTLTTKMAPQVAKFNFCFIQTRLNFVLYHTQNFLADIFNRSGALQNFWANLTTIQATKKANFRYSRCVNEVWVDLRKTGLNFLVEFPDHVEGGIEKVVGSPSSYHSLRSKWPRGSHRERSLFSEHMELFVFSFVFVYFNTKIVGRSKNFSIRIKKWWRIDGTFKKNTWMFFCFDLIENRNSKNIFLAIHFDHSFCTYI